MLAYLIIPLYPKVDLETLQKRLRKRKKRHKKLRFVRRTRDRNVYYGRRKKVKFIRRTRDKFEHHERHIIANPWFFQMVQG